MTIEAKKRGRPTQESKTKDDDFLTLLLALGTDKKGWTFFKEEIYVFFVLPNDVIFTKKIPLKFLSVVAASFVYSADFNVESHLDIKEKDLMEAVLVLSEKSKGKSPKGASRSPLSSQGTLENRFEGLSPT